MGAREARASRRRGEDGTDAAASPAPRPVRRASCGGGAVAEQSACVAPAGRAVRLPYPSCSSAELPPPTPAWGSSLGRQFTHTDFRRLEMILWRKQLGRRRGDIFHNLSCHSNLHQDSYLEARLEEFQLTINIPVAFIILLSPRKNRLLL